MLRAAKTDARQNIHHACQPSILPRGYFARPRKHGGSGVCIVRQLLTAMLRFATSLLETANFSHHLASIPALLRDRAGYRNESRHLSSDRDNDDPAEPDKCATSAARERARSSGQPPLAPGDEECCGSGCSRCVWLEYAEDLVEFYKDGGARAAEAVAKIPDPIVRQFVKTELDYILKNKHEK